MREKFTQLLPALGLIFSDLDSEGWEQDGTNVVSMAATDAHLKTGCEAKGGRYTLEGWRERTKWWPPDRTWLHRLARSNSQSTGRKRKRAMEKDRTPGKCASRCDKTVLITVKIWELSLTSLFQWGSGVQLAVRCSWGKLRKTALLVLMFLQYLLGFCSFNKENIFS